MGAYSRIRRSAGLLLLTLAGGCAVDRGLDLPELSDWETRQAVLREVDEFDFNGRVAVRAGDDGFNAKLRWSQQGERFFATLSGPLGIGTVRIEGNGPEVELTDKDGETTRLDDVELDLYYRYGWTIPVESLRYWALGIPDPRVPADTELNADGRLAALRQRGWAVSFARYREAGGGQPMPSRLTAENASTRVRVVVDRWVFHEQIGLPAASR